MNRLFVSIMMIFALVLPVSISHALDSDADNPHHLADYMLDTSQVYVGSQMGADYFDDIDNILLSVYEKLPAGLEFDRFTIDAFMSEEFDRLSYDWNDFKTLLGDYIAVAIEPSEGVLALTDTPYTTVVAEITDTDTFIDALLALVTPLENIPPNFIERDGYLVYEDADVVIYATETLFIASTHPAYELPLDASLGSDEDFQQTIATLPADTYSGLVYIDGEYVFDEGDQLRDLLATPADETGSMALGITSFEPDVLAFDVAIPTQLTQFTEVNIATMETLLPDGTDAFIVGNNLTNVYNTLIDFAQMQAQASGEDDFTQQLPFFFGMTGLDLEEDVLSWTTGNYAIFTATDTATIIDQIEQDEMISDLPLEFGIVIEATDPALARNTADQFGEFLDTMLGSEPGFTITRSELLTRLSFELPNDDFFNMDTLDLVIAANDNLFYVGTPASYDRLNAGKTSLEVASITPYLLDNANSVWYLNGDGATLPIVTALAVTPSRETAFPLQTPEDAFAFLRSIDDLINYQTISTSLDADGVFRLRATITLES